MRPEVMQVGRTLAPVWRVLLLAVLLIALGGCALPRASGNDRSPLVLAEPRDGTALVYLMRPAHGFSSEIWPTIELDGRSVGELRNGYYRYVEVIPGQHTLVATKSQWYSGRFGERSTFSVRAGQVSFWALQVIAGKDPKHPSGRRWVELEAGVARRELNGMRLSPATENDS